ncbi:M28 family peptidase [Patulibacter sp. SYSU D01012]|uniref:M28 family peptidase n=1 Tax=Patulibacter sp. SYSU D01012 TaxID=2817381 RepID=UPI001B316338|nr:M28 family peptidase [Patulibacter sp. SYSU D01012]
MATRVGIGALLLAVLIAAFSLARLPGPLKATLPADVFDGAAGVRLTGTLADAYPDRRAGSPGDAALARRVRDELRRAVPTATVTVDRFQADTPDGARTLENVSATLPGQPGPEILVVAHRDALGRGARAEMTGTAGLLAVARAAGQGRFRHTIRFVSTTGGSGGGLAGATRLARETSEPVAAAIVLGDLSGDGGRPARVLGWSNGPAGAPVRLGRTVEEALRAEGLRPATSDGLWKQLARRGLPASVGEQAELNQAGIPAVLLTTGTALPPPAGAPLDARRFEAFGRSALRSVLAVDGSLARVGPPQTGLVVAGQELPSWAVRVLLVALLLPLLAGALVLALAVARDALTVLAGLAWTLGCAAGPLIAGLVAIGLGRVGLVDPATPAPFGGPALRPGTGAWVAVVALVLLVVGTIAVARPFLTREATGRHRPTRTSVAFGVFLVVLIAFVAALVRNPVTAVLLTPALVAWPAAIAPLPGLERPQRVAIAALGALLPVAAALTVVADLDVPLVQAPWWALLLVAGGHISPLGMLLISLVIGAGAATAMTLVPPLRRGRPRPPRRRLRRAPAPEPAPPAPDEAAVADDAPPADEGPEDAWDADDWGDGTWDADGGWTEPVRRDPPGGRALRPRPEG